MNPVFVDTSALIALGNSRDQYHRQAKIALKELILAKRTFITTNAVILELANAFSAARHKYLAIRLIDLMINSKDWQVINIDASLMNKGIEKFRQVADKDWGVVDCISIIIAENYGITEIFTNDHHFEQAGFITILK
jgi:uncharacterized protein